MHRIDPQEDGTFADLSRAGSSLLVIMSNPPLSTSGDRTRARVRLLQEIVGIESVAMANLFSVPTYRTGEISMVGSKEQGWLDARKDIRLGLVGCTAVLLAYGAQPPTGLAGVHFRSQLVWLRERVAARSLPVWMVSDRPLHPSRWHRHTFAHYPDIGFREALPMALRPWPVEEVG